MYNLIAVAFSVSDYPKSQIMQRTKKLTSEMQGMSFEYRGGLSELVNINLAVRFNRFSRVLLRHV